MRRVGGARKATTSCSAWVLGAILCGATALPAAAQELTLFGGATNSIDSTLDLDDDTYAWKVEYRQGLGEHFELSYSWLNEGHVRAHHRDGSILQLWGRSTILDRRLSLALGAGAFRFYDTVETSDGYSNVHGLAGVFSADAAAYPGKRWVLRAEVNRTLARSKNIDTWDFLLGVGYQLTPPEEVGPRAWPDSPAETKTNNEITLFAGETVVHSFGNPNVFAASLEYRRVLSRYFDVSASFLYEGDSGAVRRGGFIVQGSFGRAFLRDRLALSVGMGLYIAVDKSRAAVSGDSGWTLAGMVTPSVCYRFAEHWQVRFNWNRVVTTYDRDTEVQQIGIGYRF
jgi:hypothetical protein